MYFQRSIKSAATKEIYFQFPAVWKRGGYYGIPFTFLKITLLIFNKNSQNHDECIVRVHYEITAPIGAETLEFHIFRLFHNTLFSSTCHE